jgi:hypothetical protein
LNTVKTPGCRNNNKAKLRATNLRAMNLTTLLANFALIKIIYIIFFLVVVVVINVSFLRRQKKKDDVPDNADIYLTDTKICCEAIDKITAKN